MCAYLVEIDSKEETDWLADTFLKSGQPIRKYVTNRSRIAQESTSSKKLKEIKRKNNCFFFLIKVFYMLPVS